MMSPELELLDRLCGDDLPLVIAWEVFGGPADPGALAKAQRALAMQVKDGLIQIVHRTGTGEETLADWRVPVVLFHEEEWKSGNGDTGCYLRLTEKGARYIT